MKEPTGNRTGRSTMTAVSVADVCSSPHFLVTRPNRTTVKVLYDPKSAPLSSPSTLRSLDEEDGVITHLTIENHGGNLESNDRVAFGSFLHEGLPSVTSIQYRTSAPPSSSEEDDLLVVLSQHPPKNLSALTIVYLQFGEYHDFCLDGSSFPNLQSLTIRVANFYSPTCTKRTEFSSTYFKALGRFLTTTMMSSSKSLQEVSLCNVTATENNQGDAGNSSSLAWSPVIDALRSNPDLKQISLTHRYGNDMYPFHDKYTMDLIQFGPRIQTAKALLMPASNDDNDPMQASLEQWIQALLSVRDRSDCVEYFLSHYPAESIRAVQEILKRGL